MLINGSLQEEECACWGWSCYTAPYACCRCCNLSVGVALNVRFTTNGMCIRITPYIGYVARASNNRVIPIVWSWHTVSIVACCHSVKLRTCRSGFPMQHRHTAQTQGQPEFVAELVMPCEGLMLMISTVLFGDFNMHVGIDAGVWTTVVIDRLWRLQKDWKHRGIRKGNHHRERVSRTELQVVERYFRLGVPNLSVNMYLFQHFDRWECTPEIPFFGIYRIFPQYFIVTNRRYILTICM